MSIGCWERGYEADWFREGLKDKGIRACIPGRKQRKARVTYDKRRYKRRNRPLVTLLRNALPGSDRDHVRQAQGLAPHCHALRPMPESLPISHRSRRCRHLLAMSPEPRQQN